MLFLAETCTYYYKQHAVHGEGCMTRVEGKSEKDFFKSINRMNLRVVFTKHGWVTVYEIHRGDCENTLVTLEELFLNNPVIKLIHNVLKCNFAFQLKINKLVVLSI